MSELQDRVMRRVRIVRSMRRLTGPTFLKIYTIALLFIGVTQRVSVGAVLQNLPHDPSSQVGFFTAAFLGADTAVKFVTIAAALLLLWLAKDLVIPSPSRSLARETVQ